MRKSIHAWFFILFLSVGLFSCDSNSPKASADKFLTSLYRMDYETAKSMSTENTRKLVDMIAQFSAMVPDSVKENAKKTKVNIKDVKEEGDKATVTYTVKDPASGKSQPMEQKLTMIKQNGQWLAEWTKPDANRGDAEAPENMNDLPPADTSVNTAPPADGTATDTSGKR